MNQFEERIQNILQEEMEMPEVVNDKVSQAFSTIQQRSNGMNKQKRLKRGIKAAAIAFAVVLSVGTTAVAAVKHFGLLDYFSQWNQDIPKEAADMIVNEVEQQEQSEEGKLITFKVREYLCDANQVYIVIEAKPTDDKYMIIPQWVEESEPIVNIGMTDATEMSIAEYAASQGKELIYAGANVDTGAGSYSYDFRMEDDGTALYILSGANETGVEVKEFTCNTFVYSLDATNMEDISRDSFVFNMENNSKEEVLEYTITDTSGADELGMVIDDIVISETELGIHVEFLYHYSSEITSDQRKENDDICFMILGENGAELESTLAAGGWAEVMDDGSFKRVGNYKKVELPSELTILLKNMDTEEEYGTVKMQKQ